MPLPCLQPHRDGHDIEEAGPAEIGADMESQLVAARDEFRRRQQRRIGAAIGIGVSVAMGDVPASLLVMGTGASTVTGLIGGLLGRRRG